MKEYSFAGQSAQLVLIDCSKPSNEHFCPEQRKADRYDLGLLCHLQTGGDKPGNRPVKLVSKNISSYGALFQTKIFFPPGSEVEVAVMLPSIQEREAKGPDIRVKIRGKVIRLGDNEMAIRFYKNPRVHGTDSLKN